MQQWSHLEFDGVVMREYGTNATEQALIRRMGGRVHKNSGRGHRKADGTWHQFIIDVKECKSSFTLSQKVWAKVCTDAAKTDIHKNPALIVVFGGKTKLAVVALDVLEELIEGGSGAESD